MRVVQTHLDQEGLNLHPAEQHASAQAQVITLSQLGFPCITCVARVMQACSIGVHLLGMRHA